jgi:hypothetical protein
MSDWKANIVGLLIGGVGFATLLFATYWKELLGFVVDFLLTPMFPVPTTGPSGYGLTYWSLSLIWPIGRAAVPLSLSVSAILLLVVYAKHWQLRGSHDVEGIVAVFLASISAIFLGFRLVAENYVVWLVPLMAILVVYNRLEGILFWGTSLLAFVFSITNSLLPFYLLPVEPWIGAQLAAIVGWVSSYRIMPAGAFQAGLSVGTVTISAMGTGFSILMVLVLLESIFFPGQKIVHWLTESCIRLVTKHKESKRLIRAPSNLDFEHANLIGTQTHEIVPAGPATC